MNNFYILCFICFWCQISCAPVELGFYDAIAEKCPSIKSISTYKEHQLFTNTCKDWKTISAVTELKNNEREIRCLLFFEAFTQYCSKGKVNVSMSDAISVPYKLADVCLFVKTVPNKSLHNIFSKESNCAQICGDEMGSVRSVCRSSFYFFHLNATSEDETKVQPQEPHLETPHVNKSPNPSRESQNEQADKSVAVQHQTDKSASAPQPETEESAVLPLSATAEQKAKIPAEAVLPPEPQKKSGDTDLHKQPGIEPPQETNNEASGVVEQPAKGEVNSAADVKPEPQNSDVEAKAQNQVAHSTDKVQEIQQVNAKKNGPTISDGDASKVVETPEKPQVNDNTNGVVSNGNENDKQPEKPDSENKNVEIGDNPDLGDETMNQGQLVDPNQANMGEDDIEADDGQGDSAIDSLRNEKDSKPLQTDESEPVNYNTEMDGDSYFFTYFMLLCIIFIVGYVCYHNKQKILALILEGRRGKRQYRGRRPNSANYHKLDSNLEEAITSSCKKNTNNVIY